MHKIVSDRPGHYDRDPATIVLRCPWHGYEFDVSNGRCVVEPNRIAVRHMELEVDGDEIIVASR
jgi:3-phenylpropionate/trans-cinnamate dioxygenase ferredoxin subunit